MFLADETAANRHLELGVIHCRDALVEVPFGIYATNNTTILFDTHFTLKIGIPEEALATIDTLQRHALGGTQHHASAAQGIIHTQRPLLVGAEHEATAELIVDIAHSHADEAVVVGSIEIGQTYTIEFTAETVQLRQESFETHTRRKVAVGVVHFTKAIDTHLFAIKVRDTDTLVKHIVLRIGLVTAAHLTVFSERLSTRSDTDQGEC